ncbi:Beta-ketoacyl synthase [Beauveria brongniartii RCEF 3172]|uniref:Beta-ketoacyl synthase n=1 Tax=Beauveria brongniartii RCEF 3172 TaxID=1081107 RepID=A0A167JCH2_9HYPO|nr:Beta-ketoacyl synthase [Beauveria brongniartii RCEF 3172]
MEPIAIVGSACRFPGDATSPSKLWDLLKSPRDLSQDIERFNVKGFYHENGHHHGATNVVAAYMLEGDPMQFDPQFFNIQPGEAESMDPQHRLLLETTYEGLETAGIPIETLRGSDTSAFIGVMSTDYTTMVFFDSECTPTYSATGTSRAVLSNRLSHAFDWHGASMTIDTACSSSLVAIHLAVQELRAGSSRVAVAGGTNLILSADPFISETNLDMLSPQGKCHMWDARANGYARGEGIGVVVLKTLRDALADGDHIESIIRETGVNQDGHTPGITMPNPQAQTKLIRDVYARAGLDISKEEDRCQYFEAHGTGTKAGDAVESKAIHDAFFSHQDGHEKLQPLYVGSIKTIIGHTEGTAGVAGVMRASLAIQNKTIPPNLHFQSLNPAIEPYYGNLQITSEAVPWPSLNGGVRRASVNSFGFGGANSHVIIESYSPDNQDETQCDTLQSSSASASASDSSITSLASSASSILSTSSMDSTSPNVLPLLLSASSEKTLRKLVQQYILHIRQHPDVDLASLAWTLFKSKSALNIRLAVPAPSPEALTATLETILSLQSGDAKSPITRVTTQNKPLVAVFTGQGAQWATMGRQLIQSSKQVEATVDRLDSVLAALPDSYRPKWSLKDQLLADKKESRIEESVVSQPLCTVVQVIIVDLIRSAGIDFDGVVGHSSGEIAAAYAAGFISADDAIKIAYTRGLCAHLAQGRQGEKGGMIAAAMTHPDAKDLCENEAALHRISVAAYNSPTSVTLSGDGHVIDQVAVVLDDEEKFNRILRVQTAYHSHHMKPCVSMYREALAACEINILSPTRPCPWFSSVYGGSEMIASEDLKCEYWIKNMVQPVLFSEAVSAASRAWPQDTPAAWVEIGPHAALKSPVLETLKSLGQNKVAYSGTLSRAADDVDMMASFLGWLWSVSAQTSLDLNQYAAQFSQSNMVTIRDLPSYPWDHDHSYEFESRKSRAHRFRETPGHPLLGVRADTCGDNEYRWENFLSSEELPWLTGHNIQGQMVVPAAMFLVMASEAATIAAASLGFQGRLTELHDSVIHRGLALDDERAVETLFYLSDVKITSSPDQGSILSANYYCDAAITKSSNRLTSIASGKIKLFIGDHVSQMLPAPAQYHGKLDEIDVESFYDNLRTIGYNYSDAFRGIASLKRTTNLATGTIAVGSAIQPSASEGWLPVHPAVLDVSFQALFAALSYPGDGGLQTLQVPTTIKRLTINSSALSESTSTNDLTFSATSYVLDRRTICGDIQVAIAGTGLATFSVQGLTVSPVSPLTAQDDKQMFADMVLCSANPNTALLPKLAEELTGNVDANINGDSTVSSHSADEARSYQVLASLLKQITDRYPKARILERTSGNATEILDAFKAAGGRPSLYVLDGIDEASFTELADSRDDASYLKRASLLLESSDFVDKNTGQEYDVVILRGGYSLEKETLKNLRHLIRPGGYLLFVHQQNAQALTGSTDNLDTWHNRLVESGFSGTDAQSCTVVGSSTIMATMATDDTVNALRQPMLSSGSKIPKLLIIGGDGTITSNLINELHGLLAPFCDEIRMVKSLAHLDLSDLTDKPFALSLTELDYDLFRSLSEKTLVKLQELTTHSNRLVWVVSGTQGGNPYANMIKGTLRCLIEECSHLVTQILDIEGDVPGAFQFIAEAVMGLHRLHSIKKPDHLLWSHEPELHLRNGQALISRYLPNKDLDSGYNSLRRHVEVDMLSKTGLLQLSAAESSLSLEKLRVTAPPSLQSTKKEITTEIAVNYSPSVCVHIPTLGYLYPVTGVDVQTGRVVAALSTENRSRVSAHKTSLVPLVGLSEQQESLLTEKLCHVFRASTIIQRCPPLTSVVVHEAPDMLAQILVDEARKADVRLIFTSSDASRCEDRLDQEWKHIARHGSTRQLSEMVQPDTLLCVDCTETGSSNGLAFMELEVPSGITVLTASDFFRATSYKFGKVDDDRMFQILQAAVDKAASLVADETDDLTDSTIQVQDLPREFAFGVPAKTISWTSNLPVRATILPALEECHFRPDRTYFLVGMAGSLGLSTVSYMISRGARYFALSSRNPQVDSAWIAAKKTKYGAIVNTFALDVTDKSAIEKTIATINETMPPIAGVANGALVMEDSLFMDLTFEKMMRALGPKVDGSRYLDELFDQDSLDFFILYSSLVSIAGNTGQIAYAVANSFMVGLAHHRRRRGLAASVINLTGVSGVGFITRTGHNILERSKALGYDIISESDYCYIFAEAVLASPSNAPQGPEVSSSLRYVDVANDKVVPPWAYDSKFGHYLLDRSAPATNDAPDEASDSSGRLSLAALRSAPPAECFDTILHAFQILVQKLLRLPAGEHIPPESSVLDLGVDSLVAVKMRQWFLKELQVNVPVMKLIGGATISEVVWSVVNQVSPPQDK